jgi:hypothetical protein
MHALVAATPAAAFARITAFSGAAKAVVITS